ncbi:hypothetical protein, conserved [Trypanosoma brucei gambiense DAL972]|uniref:Metallo-beta-lactamase domain-containing protein n=1 Tax=Trypanosoma brucei gambiense (strain MHOM/CI/86/DAL972) TaxID=679716 RepID=C9ZSM3_TRYB9|nr:hypothetical protein, conserved [Trypanosoma brucei gambiense DAL972]CBH12407.1 hypothetical protein, conserved [Trypanosoma brucei gambiense DAL972]|eukprot:XP_011774688.1 hypothetical protein, conserved [Trypanosoma brucei gambiense DAL972]
MMSSGNQHEKVQLQQGGNTRGRFCSVTIVGSGVSTGVPVIGHLSSDCACAEAFRDPQGPDRRNNVSLLITVRDAECTGSDSEDDRNAKHVLIDCGKTFRDAYFRVLAKHKVRYLDGLLLTHDHADAAGGVDDLRDLQRVTVDDASKCCTIEQYISTYASEKTIESLRQQFGYIVRNSWLMGPAPTTAEEHELVVKRVREDREREGQTDNIGYRRSAALHLYTLPDTHPSSFYIPGFGENFPMYALPVEHGKGYMSLGFVFGRGVALRSTGASSCNGYSCVVYLSDVSEIPPNAMSFLHDLVKIDVLFVDMLYGPEVSHPSHYCMDDTLQLVCELQPARTYAIGMYCDIKHAAGNRLLKERLEELRGAGKCGDGVITVELGYDGMTMALPLS